jgi:hypothetical protein
MQVILILKSILTSKLMGFWGFGEQLVTFWVYLGSVHIIQSVVYLKILKLFGRLKHSPTDCV